MSTLSSFTYNANPSGSYSFKISPLSGPASSRVLNFAIDHVTINDSKRTGLEPERCQRRDDRSCQRQQHDQWQRHLADQFGQLTITNSTTTNNAWGGLALYQSNVYSTSRSTDRRRRHQHLPRSRRRIYAQDQSAATDFGAIDLTGQGINYVATLVTPAASGDGAYLLPED